MVSKLMAFFECDGIINNDNNNNNEQEKLDQNNKSSIIGQIQLSYTNTDNNNNYYYCHCGEYELNVTKNRKLNHLPEVKISAPATLSVATTHTNNTFLYVRYLLFVIIGLIIMIETTIASDTSTTATTTTSPFVTSVLSVSYSSASPLTLCTMINSSSSNISCNSINDDDNNNKSLKPSSSSANNNDIVLNLLLEKPIGTTHSPPAFTKTTASTKNIISNIENNFTTMTTTPYPLWQQKNNKNEDKYERPTIIKTILTTISSPTSSLLSFRPSSNTINSSSHSLSSLQLKKATTKDQMLNNPTGLKNNMTFIVVSDIINLETTMSPFSQMISRSKLLSNENEWNDEQKIHITTTMSTTLINTNNVTLSKKSENSDNILSNNNTIMTGTEMIKNIIIEQNLKEKSVQIDHNQISKLNNFIVNPTILPEVSVIGNDNSDEVDDEIMMIMPSSSYMHRIHRRRHLNNDFNDTIQIINHNVSDLNIVVNNDYHYNKMIIKNIQPVQHDTITNQTKLSINRLIDGKMLLKFNDYNQTKNWNKLNFNEKLLNESEQMIMLSDATHTNSNSTNNNFLQQHNIYRYYSQRQENDLKTLLSRYPSLRLPPPPPEFADDFDPGITEVSTVSGSSVDIPCNTTWIEDEVSLVLWFRGDTGVPIYRVDARNVPLSKAIHTISDESRKRLYFDMKQQPPVLRIKPVMASDAAEYRCRVDFRQSRTQNVIVLLNVTVPPKELLIMDVEGQKLEGVIGPYDEGSNVILICEAEGGKPSPSVNWYQANRLIDSTYTIGPHGLVRNELNIRNLNRSDFMSILTCRASNNNVTEPISATVILDMNLRPIDVKILPKSYLKSKLSSSSSSHTGSITSSTIMIDPRLSFILPAGSKAEFQCQSTGSRPAAQISWWLGNERLSSNVRDSVNEDGNATVSTIVFVPSVDDNGKLLTCRADNLPMPHTALKDERLLNVQFAPQLRISFGTNIQTDSIREGSDVYMECRVKANPPVKEVVWLHEDRPIHSLMSGDPNMMPDDSTLPSLSSTSVSLGSTVIMTNQSLVIQKVHRSHRGRYQCVAFNEQGETISDPLYLKVNFAPSCKPGQKLQYGVSRNEQIRIRCEVDAEPSNDLTFRWTLNTSGNGETSVEWASFTVNATTSIATYRPESSLDYGTLSCLAQNSIGIQNKPCIYSVVPAGRPDAVRGCAITNHSMSTLLVECIPGDDGGLKQHFNLEVYIGSSSSSSNIGNSINTINANNQIVDQTLAVQSASIATTTATKTNSINSNSLLQHPQRLHSNHSSSQPNFIVSSLTPGTPYTLVLYATNAKGRSHSVSLSAVTLSAPEKHTARGSFEQIVVHPILGILIGIVATIVIAVIILIILIRSRIGSNNNNSDGSRDTGINNCRDNNGHNNNHNDNNHRKRRNKQQQQQSSLQSTTTTTAVACTRRSLNGTNSTMMIANVDDDDDDNNMDRSIDQSANDALLTIGSTTTSPIITSNGDLKLKRIKHQQTSSSSKLPHESKESKNNIILFRKKSPSKNQQKQYKNNNNKNNDNQKQFGNISANDSIADTANHNDVDVDVDKDIDLGNLNEHEKVCLVGNNDMIDTNIQDQCHQMPLHYPICSSEEPLLSTINSNTNNHLMTTTIASSNNNDNNLQNNSSEIIMQSKNVHHSFNPNCDIGHLQQQSSSQKGVGGSVITNINTNATIDNNRTPYDTSLSRGTKGSFNHRTSIITPSGPYIHHTNNTGNISATQLLDLSSTASSTGLSSSSTSSLSPNQISNTKSIPISAIGIIGQPQSQLPPLPHHQILYSHSSPSNGSPNHHHLNSPYDINGSESVAALAAAQYSQYHPYMNTAQYISPHHHQHYVDPNNISCLYTTTSSSSTNSPSYHQQMYETGESTLFVDSYETAPSGQFMTDFTAQHQPHHQLQQQQHHHTHQQPILYYNPNDEITVNETMVNNNYSNNNSPNNKKTLSTTSSKRCNVTLLQSATSPTTPSSSLATTDLPSIDATNNSSSLYVTTIDQKLTKNNSNTVMKNLSNCDPQQQQQLYHPRQSSNSSSRYSSNNNNINNNNNNSEQTQSSSSSSSHEKICLINKRNGTAV